MKSGRTKDNAFATFGDNGYHRGAYRDPKWRDTTKNGEIDAVVHPLSASGAIRGSRFNCIQKAITYCIARNGGSCHEQYLIKFLDDHWDYINSDRQKPLTGRPDMRLVRVNVAAKKDMMHLFKEKPEGSGFVVCSVARGNRHSTEEFTHGPAPTDSKNENDGMRDVCADGSFSREIVNILRNAAVPMSLAQITTAAAAVATCDGIFADLVGERRVRATLIVLKAKKAVSLDMETGMWSAVVVAPAAQVVRQVSKVMTARLTTKKENMDDSILPNVKISSLNIGELYDLVRARNAV